MLWEIENTPHRIIGSAHLLDRASGLPQWAHDSHRGTRRFVFESDLSTLPDGAIGRDPACLYSRRYTSVYRAAGKLMARAGNISPLEDLKPWRAGLRMSSFLSFKAGFRHACGLDSLLRAKAVSGNHEMDFLEGPSRAHQLLDTFCDPVGGGVNFLKRVVRDARTGGGIRRSGELTEAWMASDIGLFESHLDTKLKTVPCVFHPLITVRNREWAAAAAPMIRGRIPTLFVVGALHTVGPGSFIEELRAQGFTCRPHSG